MSAPPTSAPDAERTARAGGAVLLICGAACLAAWVWAWTALPPEGVVHHTGPDGPNRLGSRAGILWPLMIFGPLLVLGIRWFVAFSVRSGDGNGLNYPHKKYWLAPERREEFRRRVVGEFDVFLGATLLLLTVVLFEVVRITAEPDARSLMVPAMVGYGAVAVWWVWWVLRRSRPPRTA